MNKLLVTLILILGSCITLVAQKGKDGFKTIAAANVKINEFTTLTSNANKGDLVLNVASSSLNSNARFTNTLTTGDLVMVLQMQGAYMKLSPVPVWAPDSTYGNVYNYANCGNYEFAQVKSVISATQIQLDCSLQYSYTVTGKTQIIRVPRYHALMVSSTGTLTTDAWNGTIGGVLVAEVDSNTTVSSGGLISVTGLGFRGGAAISNGGTGNSNYATKNPNDGAEKGEGIGSDRLNNSFVIDTLGRQCMGAPANGGGGADANNCGGGGGANAGGINTWNGYGVLNPTYSAIFNLEYIGRGSVISSGGGRGGYGTSTTNNNPTTNGPNNSAAWGSFLRPSRGGFGGRPLDYSTGKIFMGGGGGAGHMSGQSNGTNACSGGNGGGIFYLLNYGTVSGTGTITANGANGNNAFGSSLFSSQGIDGAGGAGGGGAILINSTGTVTSIVALANGGNGGNQIKSGLSSSEAQGPGGGGGGGYIASNGGAFSQTVNGGINGTTNASNFVSTFPMNGATSGNVGLNNQLISSNNPMLIASANQTICTGNSINLTATSTNTDATIMWYNTSIGGNSIATGTVYTTPNYTLASTYTLYAGSCSGVYRKPIVITVNGTPNVSVSNQTICAGQTTTLTAVGSALNYSWSTGATSNSISVTPTVTTTYTLVSANGACTSQTVSTVYVGANLSVAVNSASICIGQTATLSASGAATYSWSTNSNSPSIVVNPTVTTTYTVNGSNGSCTGFGTSTVTVNALPIISITSATICSSQSATVVASGALTYTWNNGTNTNSVVVSSNSVSVVGTDNNGCVSSATAAITIVNSPTLTVNSVTMCIGSTTTLTVNGAMSYTWDTGVNGSSITVSPSVTTTYSVIGSNGVCNAQIITTVVVVSQPSISINSSSFICNGQSANLSVTGASSYTWSNGIINASQTVTPNATTTYSVVGSIGSCVSLPQTTTISVITVLADFNLPSSPVALNTTMDALNNSSNATSYSWTLCDGTITNSVNASVALTTTGTCCIKLKAMNNMCIDTLTKCITVVNEASVIIPNVFTPNGDGYNDVFKIQATAIKTFHCAIYNRWGLKLFEWNDSSMGWNGINSNGSKAIDGTYYFVLEYTDFKDASSTAKGFLSLFRD